MTIIDQIAPAGPTAWLAAVGLAHLTKHLPTDPVELVDLAERGPLPSTPSRWVETNGSWLLDIDSPAGWEDVREWYARRFAGWDTDGDLWTGLNHSPRDPWWRMHGNATPHGTGARLWQEVEAYEGVDVVAELATPRLYTSAAAGWVVDRKWVNLDDTTLLGRPLVRYALAYIGATVAQDWPGHMIGDRAVGHLWDGQPSDHPTGEHVVIVWDPVQTDTRYPAWWGHGEYVTVPAPTWPGLIRDRWLDDWLVWELIGKTDARRIVDDLPEPHLVRARVPLWRRSWLLRGRDDDSPVAVPEQPSKAVESDDQPLDVHGVADRTGLSVSTLRSYVRDGRMPPEDGRMGQSLWWWASTIDTWQDARPIPGRPRES